MKLGFKPLGWNLSPEPGIQARDCDLGLRLRFELRSQGGDGEEGGGEGGGEEGGEISPV